MTAILRLKWRQYCLFPTGLVIVSMAMLLLGACASATPRSSQQPLGNTQVSDVEPETLSIIIGDVDPDEPVKKIRRFQPLADYLATKLEGFGIGDGGVVIAKNFEEMGRLLKNGEVDIYFDSVYPAIASQKISASEFLLRRSKDGVSSYWSTYVVLKERMVDSFDEFLGKVIAFEEPRSTSGYLLPAGQLLEEGYVLREVDGPAAEVKDNEIGYFFSRDEENTIDMVLRGMVAAGGISNQDFDELPPELSEKLDIFGRTIAVPRQIVSLRPGMDPAIKENIRDLLLGLKDTPEGRQILEDMKESAFDPLPADFESTISHLRSLSTLVTGG